MTKKWDICYFASLFPATGKCEGAHHFDVQLSFGERHGSEAAAVGDEAVSTFVRSCEHHKPIGDLLTKMARDAAWPANLRRATTSEFADKDLPLVCPECQHRVFRFPVIDLHAQARCSNIACDFKEAQSLATSLVETGLLSKALVDDTVVALIKAAKR